MCLKKAQTWKKFERKIAKKLVCAWAKTSFLAMFTDYGPCTWKKFERKIAKKLVCA